MDRTDPPQRLSKLHFGLQIEAKAEAWFLAKFPEARFLARNFRWKGGEIDLVFEMPQKGRPERLELVFVEVRARLPGAWVSGIQSVDGMKLRRLRGTIEIFLARRYSGRAQSLRVDLLSWDGKRFEHWPNAWQT